MPINLPAGATPTKSRNKSKADAELSSFEKKNKRVYMSICIDVENIDGKDVVLAKCEGDPYNYDGTMKLPEKYSDMNKFASYVKDRILAAAKVFES